MTKRAGQWQRKHSVSRIPAIGVLGLFALLAPLGAQDEDLVFRSDVTLVRVDVQVLDRAGQRIPGLTKDDFLLRKNGQPTEIRAFGFEQVPLDIVLLIDVSGSMRPHVERIAMGVRSAMRALGPDDQVAVMVFDRRVRVKLGLDGDHDRVAMALEDVLDSERFNSGTAITRALKEAAVWLATEARPDSRRAIVILTDDETGDGRDEEGVLAALDRGQSALSVLLAPGSERSRRGGVSWPGRRGGIILGGPRFPVPGPSIDMMQSAGVREIARETGGDTFRVEESSALRMTFERLRQRYALFYSDPTGAAAVEVTLANRVFQRYPGAELAYRRPGAKWGEGVEQPPVLTRAPVPEPRQPRKPGWSQDGEDDEAAPIVEPPGPPPPATTPQERKGGWRTATPEDTKPTPPERPVPRRKP